MPVLAQPPHSLADSVDRAARDVEDTVDVQENGGHGARVYSRHALGLHPALGDRPALLPVEWSGRPARAEERNAGRSDLRRRGLVGAHVTPEAAGRPESGLAASRSRAGRAEPDKKPGARDRAIGRATRGRAQSRAAASRDEAEQSRRRETPRAEAPPLRDEALASAAFFGVSRRRAPKK